MGNTNKPWENQDNPNIMPLDEDELRVLPDGARIQSVRHTIGMDQSTGRLRTGKEKLDYDGICRNRFGIHGNPKLVKAGYNGDKISDNEYMCDDCLRKNYRNWWLNILFGTWICTLLGWHYY